MNKKYLVRFWWLMLLRGIAAFVFAYLAFFWTNITLEIMVIFFGVYMLVDGMFTVASAVEASKSLKNWWFLLLEGIFGVVIGSIAFIYPIGTAIVLFYFIAFWIIITGILEVWAAYRIDWGAIGKWFMLFIGVLSLIVGLVMLLNPLESLQVIIWLLGIYALVFGVGITIFSFTLKKIK